MSNRKKKTWTIIGIILGIIVLAVGGGMIAVQRGLPEMQDLVINEVNPEMLEDGVYTGEFSSYRWTNKVRVTVQQGRIVEIESENSGDLEQELAERIIAKQSLSVDINTGATVSSNAFLKAVEDALTP